MLFFFSFYYIVNSFFPCSVYDLQDLHSLSMMSNKESKRLSSTNRRGSLLPFKLGGGGSSSSINTTNDESIPLLKCHAILKIEKALQQRIPKVYSFTMMKHSSFLSNVYAVTPKTSMIMLVHVRSSFYHDTMESNAPLFYRRQQLEEVMIVSKPPPLPQRMKSSD